MTLHLVQRLAMSGFLVVALLLALWFWDWWKGPK